MVANQGACSDGVTDRRYNTAGGEINPQQEPVYEPPVYEAPAYEPPAYEPPVSFGE